MEMCFFARISADIVNLSKIIQNQETEDLAGPG